MQLVQHTYKYEGNKLFTYYGKAVFNIYEFYTCCEFFHPNLKHLNGNTVMIRLKKANPGRSPLIVKKDRVAMMQTTVEKMKGIKKDGSLHDPKAEREAERARIEAEKLAKARAETETTE